MLLDKITQIVQDYADDAIVKNPAVPNEKNNQAINETAASLMKQLSGKAGSMGAIKDMFNPGQDLNSNATVSKISKNVAGDLSKKLGINSGAAADIVGKLIPVVLAKIKNRTNDPNDNEFNLDDIVGMLGKSGGFMNILKGFLKK